MDTTHTQHTHAEQETPHTTAAPAPEKYPWQEPKLAFVEPKLTPHGELHKVTGVFLGRLLPRTRAPDRRELMVLYAFRTLTLAVQTEAEASTAGPSHY